MIKEEDIIEVLESYAKSYLNRRTQYAIFINNKHVFIGKAKAYLTFNKAKSMIINLFRHKIYPYNGSTQTRKDISDIVNMLIEQEVIEIKQIL